MIRVDFTLKDAVKYCIIHSMYYLSDEVHLFMKAPDNIGNDYVPKLFSIFDILSLNKNS